MRIVSLVPEATQWLVAFGTEGQVVAQSSDGNLGDVPIVESPEYIRVLEPDLIISRMPMESLAAIEQIVFNPQTLKNILESALLLAHKSGGFEQGMKVLADGEKRLAELKLRLQDRPPIPSVVLSETEPLAAAGRWFPDMLKQAGGNPRFAVGGSADTQVLPDQLEDVVRIVCRSESLTTPHLSRPYWILDGTRFGKADPTVFDTVELLAYALHGSTAGITPDERDIQLIDT